MNNFLKQQHRSLRIYFSFILLAFISQVIQAAQTDNKHKAPPLPLAYIYHNDVDLNDYWVSEKLDGVRAYWDGKHLLSRQGNIYHTPDWFTAGFPAQPLDGELWIARDRFEQLVSTVRKKQPDDGWKNVKYMIFDIPVPDTTFTQRIEILKIMFDDIDSPYLHLIEQFKITDHDALMKKLDNIINTGGEGLMLHKGDSYYLAGRSNDLLKVKTYQDAEATVIAHIPGKGKYNGMLGALLVETDNNQRFRLGTGFTDEQRRHPPPIGSVVTYKYYGKTINGLPRFASFMRVRIEE